MLQAGQHVGRYELVRLLGKGGMGQVWLARGEEIAGTRRSVALKFFQQDDDSETDTFMGEARIAMLLTHSNVVQVFDAGHSEHGRFLVMEWVDGVDLDQILKGERKRGQPIELETSMFILAQVLRGLHYAHDLRQDGQPLHIVHRDVSPHNVIISVSGEVKLADFGIARSAVHSTAGTHVKGKLRYMAPEQFEGGTLSAGADLFAVGAILHEMVSNTFLRTGRSAPELYREIMDAPLPSLAVALPDELEQLRRRLLERDPAQRYASAEAALRALQRWSGFRDRTFAVAELCRGNAPTQVSPKSTQTRRYGRTEEMVALGNTQVAKAADTPTQGDPPSHNKARARFPLVALLAGTFAATATATAAWGLWGQPPAAPATAPMPALASAAAVDTVDPEPAATPTRPTTPQPVPAESTTSAEPSTFGTAGQVEEATGAAQQVEPTVAKIPDPRRRRKSRPRRTGDSSPTSTAPSTTKEQRPPDAKVIAAVRSRAQAACQSRDGADEVTIEFLIEADGRPALMRSSKSDPRSKCVKSKLRSARFRGGTNRRASLLVRFGS